jgi:hypothetical protein
MNRNSKYKFDELIFSIGRDEKNSHVFNRLNRKEQLKYMDFHNKDSKRFIFEGNKDSNFKRSWILL